MTIDYRRCPNIIGNAMNMLGAVLPENWLREAYLESSPSPLDYLRSSGRPSSVSNVDKYDTKQNPSS